MVTAAWGAQHVTRHVSFFKKFEGKVDMKKLEDDVSEEDDETACHPLAEAATHQRRYPTKNRRQTSFYQTV